MSETVAQFGIGNQGLRTISRIATILPTQHLEGEVANKAQELVYFVSKACGQKPEYILSKSRRRELMQARAVILFYLRYHDYFLLPLKQAGAVVRRDHTTVIHALRSCESVFHRAEFRASFNAPDAHSVLARVLLRTAFLTNGHGWLPLTFQDVEMTPETLVPLTVKHREPPKEKAMKVFPEPRLPKIASGPISAAYNPALIEKIVKLGRADPEWDTISKRLGVRSEICRQLFLEACA